MGVLLCLESKGGRDARDAAPGLVLHPCVCAACVVVFSPCTPVTYLYHSLAALQSGHKAKRKASAATL